jgi:hypothetical protein
MKLKSGVWSNSFFIIPLALALYFEIFIHAIIIFTVIILSTVFHITKGKKWENIDKIFAYLLIGYNLYLCYLSSFRTPFFLLAILFVLIGCYFYFYKKRDDWEWHLASALITVFCILGFAL